jgi:hypothetical protein
VKEKDLAGLKPVLSEGLAQKKEGARRVLHLRPRAWAVFA